MMQNTLAINIRMMLLKASRTVRAGRFFSKYRQAKRSEPACLSVKDALHISFQLSYTAGTYEHTGDTLLMKDPCQRILGKGMALSLRLAIELT